jgi:radical SAM protein (TIGR01212 family)
MEKRYRALSQVLRDKFGEKVYKVSVDAGFGCPNKDGAISGKGCIFCDTLSFTPASTRGDRPLAAQLQHGMSYLAARYRAQKFLAYLQPNSNTYGPLAELEKTYRNLLSQPGVVGLCIASRPDLVSDQVLDLLQRLAQESYIWLELGLQSAHDTTLKLINRGHDVAAFTDAVERSRGRSINICAHVILGLPGETKEMMMATARFLSQAGIEGVKIHHLYVPAGTLLEEMYRQGQIRVLRLEEYATLVTQFLERISPELIIHRLVGSAPRAQLVAPDWTANKLRALNAIETELARRNGFQGKAGPLEPVDEIYPQAHKSRAHK